MATSVKDIARIVGVAPSTVSYALNNGPRPVEKGLKERILAVAAELDYRPNHMARAMVTGRSRTIGVVPGTTGPRMLAYPFIQAVMVGLSEAAGDVQHDLLLYSHSESISDSELFRTLLDRKADGFVIIAPNGLDAVIRALVHRKVPVVTVAGSVEAGAPTFSSDNERGIELAVEHLRSLGHRKIGFVGGSPSMMDARERAQAFRKAMRARHLETIDDWLVPGDFTRLTALESARKLLSGENRPTALVCANDESALGVCEAARACGIRVPNDLSVVGFDDAPMAALVHPPLTTVRQPVEEIAAEAVRCLVRLIEGKAVPQEVRFPTSLVVRSSTAKAPRRRRAADP